MPEKTKSIVEQLIAQQETVQNDAIAKALEAHQKKQEEQQSKVIINQLDIIQNTLDNAVYGLRKVRQMEKAAKKKVQTISDAFEEFKKDADFSKFKKSTGLY